MVYLEITIMENYNKIFEIQLYNYMILNSASNFYIYCSQCFLKNKKHLPHIATTIFTLIHWICGHTKYLLAELKMIAIREIKKSAVLDYKYMGKFIDDNGDLDMDMVLVKFQELMKAEYRETDEKFVEREGRLLFLAFLKPIINGVGFYFVEPETRMSNRMDVVVTYNRKKIVIELKIWRGWKYEEEGREQLVKYLEAQNLEKGYMIFYSFNKNKEYKAEKIIIEGKEIFEITV